MRCAVAFAVTLWLGPAMAAGLHDAVREGDRAAVERLLARDDTDVNSRDAQGGTALHWAAFRGDLALLERLLARGARVDLAVTNGNTPLHQAAYAGHADVIRRLIENGADVHARNDAGYTALHWAARNGHTDAATALLGAGGRGDDAALDGSTPRTLASGHGHAALAHRIAMSAGRAASATPPAPTTTPLRVAGAAPAPGREAERYRVQLGTSVSAHRARAEWERLQAAYPDLLGTLALFLDPVPRAQGGLWYRVRTEPMDRAAAHTLCAALRQRRVDCLVSRRH